MIIMTSSSSPTPRLPFHSDTCSYHPRDRFVVILHRQRSRQALQRREAACLLGSGPHVRCVSLFFFFDLYVRLFFNLFVCLVLLFVICYCFISPRWLTSARTTAPRPPCRCIPCMDPAAGPRPTPTLHWSSNMRDSMAMAMEALACPTVFSMTCSRSLHRTGGRCGYLYAGCVCVCDSDSPPFCLFSFCTLPVKYFFSEVV